MATVIDSLVVLLGLDVSDYKKNEEEAAKATAGTAAKVTTAQKKSNDKRRQIDREQQKRTRESANEEKKRADSTVAGFKNVALQASALFLGFDSIKGFIGLLGNLNSNEAGLGRLGHNLGVNVHEMNTWGLAATRIGGKAEDVQAAFANVSKSITDLNVNAQVSPLFLLAQRMGLDIRNVTDKTKFLLDLGDKLRLYTAQHGRDAAFNIAAQAGIDATTFNLVTADNARAMLAEAEKLNNITEATAAAAAKTQSKIEALKQRGESIVREAGHIITEPAVDAVNNGISSIQDQAQAAAALVHGNFSDAWNLLKHSAGITGVVEDRAELDAALTRGEEYAKLPAGLLHTIAQIESNMNPRAVNKKTGATGLMQLMPGTFGKDVGKDTFKDIDTAAAEIARLAKHYGGDYVLAAEAYNFGQGNLDHFLKGDINPKTGKKFELPTETKNYGARVAATPGLSRANTASAGAGATNTTNVSVGQVTVNTAATDSNGVASGLASAVKRQTYTAQANSGITQ